jgi:spore cortex formation protein SpoVR/YcgB (stage V sporulation)
MNEGWATFWHYTLMTDLYDEGYITEGSYIEFLRSHTSVTRQFGIEDLPPVDKRGIFPMPTDVYYATPRLNPYALGFEMFKDIKRACENPTEEDYEYLPLIAGKPWLPTMIDIMSNFKDENFILEFLGPRVISKLKLCCIENDARMRYYKIDTVQDLEDCRKLRKQLAQDYNIHHQIPQIEVRGFDQKKERTLYIRHQQTQGRLLEPDTLKATQKYLQKIWGYPINLDVQDEKGNLVACTSRKH